MRAALCRSYGGPETVEVTELPAPNLGAGQVRVAVQAASVNFPDVLIVANEYQVHVDPPFVPGSEFAGVVTEVAGDVRRVGVGDRVMGATLVGAFAEEVVAAATSVTLVPPDVTYAEAASFGVAHRTAYHVLRSVAKIGPGEELVVLGAGSGVGLAAVQIGTVLGAKVTAVASTAEKLQAAQDAGADRVVCHRESDLRQALRAAVPGGAHVVVDPVGGHLSEPALRSLRWGGRFVTVGYASGQIPRIPLNLVLLKGVRILGFEFAGFLANEAEAARQGDAELLQLLAARRVVPHVGATFPLVDVARALQVVGDGQAVGKVVVDVAGGPR